jgi:hypothetical protein
MAPKGQNSKGGQKCKVTGGVNKGSTGTYTVEEGTGSLWCEGPGFSTECGKDKCADARGVNVHDYKNEHGTFVQEVDGTIEVPGRGVFVGNVILDAATGEVLETTATPVAAVPLGDLHKSELEVERRAAKALESYIKQQG